MFDFSKLTNLAYREVIMCLIPLTGYMKNLCMLYGKRNIFLISVVNYVKEIESGGRFMLKSVCVAYLIANLVGVKKKLSHKSEKVLFTKVSPHFHIFPMKSLMC